MIEMQWQDYRPYPCTGSQIEPCPVIHSKAIATAKFREAKESAPGVPTGVSLKNFSIPEHEPCRFYKALSKRFPHAFNGKAISNKHANFRHRLHGRKTNSCYPSRQSNRQGCSRPQHSDRLIDVLWDGRVVQMFAVDLDARGTEVK